MKPTSLGAVARPDRGPAHCQQRLSDFLSLLFLIALAGLLLDGAKPVFAASQDTRFAHPDSLTAPCQSCHDGQQAPAQPIRHIPTQLDCSSCHNSTAWLPARVDHASFDAACARCHDNEIAQGTPSHHVATIENCDTCHDALAWAPAQRLVDDDNLAEESSGIVRGKLAARVVGATGNPLPTNHATLKTGCAICHNGVAATNKIAGHINTSLYCENCHSVFAFKPARLDHSQVVGTCFECHNGSMTTGRGTVTAKPATHIKTTNNCVACHVTSTWKLRPRFDHKETVGTCVNCHDGSNAALMRGKPASHALMSDKCEACHGVVSFRAGITLAHTETLGTCISCHTETSTTTAGKPGFHPATSDLCDTCHSTLRWLPIVKVDHTQVNAGNCNSCHNGSNARGRSAGHIPTTRVCDACHVAPGLSPSTWKTISFIDHTQVLGSCSACHNNNLAVGKGTTHSPTTNRCDACHNSAPQGWVPFKTVDHNEVLASSCGGCHSSSLATVQGPSHIPTTDKCDACHSTTGFIPALRVDHTQVTGKCIDCHGGGRPGILAKPSTHIATQANCDVCHTTNKFSPAIFDHNALGAQTCVTCHNNTTAKGKSAGHIATGDLCEKCHAVAPTPWTTITAVDHSQVKGLCTDCHNVNGNIARGKSANHIRTTDACAACHTTTTWTLLVNPLPHSETVGTCFDCHNGFYKTISSKGPTHVATSNFCDRCHLNLGWTPVVSMDHAEMFGSCSSCHNGAVASGKTAAHPRTSDRCDTCHATPPAARAWTPVVRVDHNQIFDSCELCHAAGAPYARKTSSHPTTTDRCGACHLTTSWRPVFAVDHNDVLGTCISCHNGRVAPGRSVAHASTTDVCDACHSTVTFVPAVRVDHTQVILCAKCHPLPAGHSPETQDCSACHTYPVW